MMDRNTDAKFGLYYLSLAFYFILESLSTILKLEINLYF